MSQSDTTPLFSLLGLTRLLLMLLSFIPTAFSGFNPVQGFVPRFPGARPAVDLVYQGKLLRPEEALEVARSGVDLSMLDPEEGTDLWKNPRLPVPLLPDTDDLGMNEEQPFDYLGAASSQPGNFRFLVQQVDAQGVPRSYAIYASKVLHQMLLRKNLLRKLGYAIPRTQWVPSLRIRFRNALERDAFKLDLAQRTYGDVGRWIREQESSDDLLRLEDLVAVENQDQIYNLSNGYLDGARIRGRRILNALLVPYALVSSNEQSVNLFPWNAGQTVGDNVLLPYEHAEKFTPSFEDARWIARKILALSRKDWEEIVSASEFPDPVGKLLVEKLISRRNTLGVLLKLDQEASWVELSFDPQITWGPDLIRGEVVRPSFSGYATRFSAGDPDHPIDARQIGLLFKSNLISSGVRTALTLLNGLPIFSSDIDRKIADHREDLYLKQIERAMREGSLEKVPLGAYVLPTWSAGLIFSRDLAIGSYLGADGLLQLADSFGYQVALGGYLSVDGLPLPFDAYASAGVSATRTYTHLRPVKTIEAALKYPYKNAVVSRLIQKRADTLLKGVDEGFSKLSPTDQQKILQENLESLGADFEVGSSLMITDSLDFRGGMGGAWRPFELVSLGADFGKDKIILRRLHILRRSSTEYQVYQTRGDLRDFSVSVRLDLRSKLSSETRYTTALQSMGLGALKEVGFPVLNFRVNRQRGRAETDFFRIDLDPERMGVQDLREKIGALAAVLDDRDTELLRVSVKPYQAEYDFSQFLSETDFLFLSWSRIKNRILLSIRSPGGSEKRLFREYVSKTFGLDVEQAAGDTLQTVLRALSKMPVEVATAQSSSPGFSLFGRAKNRIWTYEEDQGSDGQVRERYLRISEVWNGWSIRRAKAQRILSSINERLGGKVFASTALAQTEKVLLYQIRVDMHLYDSAIRNVHGLSDGQIRDIFKHHQRSGDSAMGEDLAELGQYDPEVTEDQERLAEVFLALRRKGVVEMSRSGKARTSRSLMNALAHASAGLTSKGLSLILGGEENFLVTSRLDGFRVGDEAGDMTILGNTVGSVGSRNSSGPFGSVQQRTGMTEGELLLGWILRRAL